MTRYILYRLLKQAARLPTASDVGLTAKRCMQDSQACNALWAARLPLRGFATEAAAQQRVKPGQEDAAESAPASDSPEASATGGAGPEPEQDPKDAHIAKLEEEVASVKDRLIRTLADMENLRERSARQADNASKFAIQGFVKDFLEVPDTLERALSSVKTSLYKVAPEGQQPAGEGATPELADLDKEQAVSLLTSLVQGIEMTDKIMLQIFAKNGVARMEDVMGTAFDPNLHNALFELPDPSKEPGTIAHVVKTGYTLHGRVVRPAHVGVIRAPDN